MKHHIVEREIPNVGKTTNDGLCFTAQWVTSHVTGDRTFCVYRTENEEAIHNRVRLLDYPASRVTEAQKVIDPTAETCDRDEDRVRFTQEENRPRAPKEVRP